MKWVIEIAAIVALVAVLGTAFNMREKGLKFFVTEGEAEILNKRSATCGVEKPVVPPKGDDPSNSDPSKIDSGDPKVDAGTKTGGETGTQPGTEPKVTDGTGSGDEPSPEEKSGIPHIGLEDAKANWEDGLTFVDARAPKYYAEGHIPGARSIPAWEDGKEEKIQAIIDAIGTAEPVVVYCNESTECEDSHIIGDLMKGLGFENIYVYEGGFPGWFKAKQPYCKGEEPGSVDTAIKADSPDYDSGK